MMNQINKNNKHNVPADPVWEKWVNSFEALYQAVQEVGIHQVLKILKETDHPAAMALAAALAPRKYVLEKAPNQLAPQLLSRLQGDSARALRALKAGAAQWRDQIWLRPVGAGLADSTEPLTSSFNAHHQFIGALGLLPDGKRFASASEDGTIRIWALSPESTLPLSTLDAHSGPVNDLVCSWDDQYLISASDDQTLILWNLTSLTPLRTLRGHTDYVSAVVAIPGGRAASAGKDGTVRVWDLAAGTCLAVFEGHDAWVNALAVTPDGGLLISASINNHIKAWDLDTLSEAAPFFMYEGAAYSRVMMGNVFFTPSNDGDVGHKSHPSALLVSPDGKMLVSGGEMLILWDIESREQIVRFQAHSTSITDMVWLDEGHTLATAGQEIKIWDLTAQRVIQTFTAHLDEVTSLAADSDGRWLISGSKDRTLKYWDLSLPVGEDQNQGHSDSVIDIQFSPDERLAITAGHDGKACLWDTTTGRCLHSLTGHSGRFVYLGGFSPDGSLVMTNTSDSEVAVWSAETGKLRHMMTFPERYFHASGLSVVPGDPLAICTGMTHPLVIWDLAHGGSPEILPDTHLHMMETVFTRDGRYFGAVFFADSAGTFPKFMHEKGNITRKAPLQWWDFDARQVVWEYLPDEDPAEVGYFCHLILTDDESRVIAGTSTGWLGIFDTATGTPLAWWHGHPEGYINSLQILPDGRLLTCAHEVMGLDEREKPIKHFVLRWWHMASQKNQRTLQLSEPENRTPKINRDGTWACFPLDEKVCLWDLKQDSLAACFSGETRILRSVISSDGRTIVAGEDGGAVHVLRVIYP